MKLQKTRQVLKSFLVNTKVKMNYPITSIANPWDSVIVFIHMIDWVKMNLSHLVLEKWIHY